MKIHRFAYKNTPRCTCNFNAGFIENKRNHVELWRFNFCINARVKLLIRVEAWIRVRTKISSRERILTKILKKQFEEKRQERKLKVEVCKARLNLFIFIQTCSLKICTTSRPKTQVILWLPAWLKAAPCCERYTKTNEIQWKCHVKKWSETDDFLTWHFHWFSFVFVYFSQRGAAFSQAGSHRIACVLGRL